jgi:integrase
MPSIPPPRPPERRLTLASVPRLRARWRCGCGPLAQGAPVAAGLPLLAVSTSEYEQGSHRLRHTFAAFTRLRRVSLIRNGVDVRTVQELLRHADPAPPEATAGLRRNRGRGRLTS